MKLNKKKVAIVSGGVIAVVLCAYLALCFVAKGEAFLSDCTINGIAVGKMSKTEAMQAVVDQYHNDVKDGQVSLNVEDQEYTLDLSDQLVFDYQDQVEEIYQKNQGSFLLQGYRYLFDHDYHVSVSVKDEAVLKERIQASGVLDYNTMVPTSYQIVDQTIVFTKGTSGKQAQEKTILKNVKQALKNYQLSSGIDCDVKDVHLDSQEMEALHKELSKGAKDATLDKNNNYQITDSQVGVEFDLEQAIVAYDDASQGEEFTLDALIQQPSVTKEMLEANLFRDVLGEYTTSVAGSSTRKNNVRLAGEKCNQVILLPGEEFSYNSTVGKRTKANGFGEAGAYLNGETVQEVGGGICQTTSTLYNAVLLSDLEVTQRSNHTFISSYVPIGLDATVSWGGPDFKFKNNTLYPIKIEVSYANSRITTRIYGTNVDGKRVELKSSRTATIPYTTTYEDDPTLLEGQTRVKAKGSNGAKAISYRYVYDSQGQLISSNTEATSTYKPHNEVILRGTKKAEVQEPTPIQPSVPDDTPEDSQDEQE